jgi:hypothetical protein
MRVLGAVAQPPERLIDLPVGELDQVERVGDQGDAGGGAGPVGGRQVHGQVAQPPGVPGQQVFFRLGGAALGQAQAPAGAEVH